VEHCPIGNPCIPATGGKTLHETDFTWEGLTFQRHYHSIRDVPSKGHLGPAWSHSFSWRLQANDATSTRIDIQSDRNTIEVYQQINGSPVFRPLNGDQGQLVKGSNGGQVEWTLYTQAGEQRVFDAAGFLVALRFPDAPERDLTVDYCTFAEFKQDICSAPATIQKVESGLGRTLAFAYERATPIAPTLGTRLVGIASDAGVLVEYGYGLGNRLETVSYPDPEHGTATRTYVYNEPANICKQGDGSASPNCTWSDFPFHVTGIIDETGVRFADYAYDHAGRVTRSSHADDTDTHRLEYVHGHYTKVTLPSGGVRHYQYTRPADIFSKPASVSDGAGTKAYTYQADGRLATFTNERGTQTVYEYDATHRTARVEANGTALQRRIETDWHATLHRPAAVRIRDAAGTLKLQRTESYNTRGQHHATTLTDPDTGASRTTTTTFCEAADLAVPQSTCPILGLRKTVDGPRTDVADVTNFRYYPATDETGCETGGECHRQGDLWQVVNALGQVTTTYLRYDFEGRVVRLQDANAVITDLEYHPRGWLLAQKVRGADPGTEVDDAITRYEYDALGQVTATVDPDGVRMEYEYDAAHRLVAMENASGHRLEYTLDASGNRIAEHSKDAAGVVRRSLNRTFDNWNRLDHELDAYGRVTDHDYSATHDWDSVQDALLRTTRSEHDPLGRLAKTIQDYTGLSVATHYSYDVLENLVAVTDPKGLVTQYGYDALGHLKQLSSPDTGVTTYQVDAAGNRIQQVDARGVMTQYGYDALGRLTSIAHPNSQTSSIAFHYDAVNADCPSSEESAVGRLHRFTDGSGETRFCYDRFGHLRRKIQVTDGFTQVLVYGMTPGGTQSSITYPSGTQVSYGRDAAGQVIAATVTPAGGTAQPVIVGATYLPFGPPSSLSYDGGRVQMRQYDANYGIDAIDNGLAPEYDLDFTLDAVGNPIQIATGIGGNQYTYDSLHRLTTAQSLAGAPIESFTYDVTGNRLSKTQGAGMPQAYGYPATSHRLTSVSGAARSYDASGSLIDKGDGWTFSYDARQRLQAASYQGIAQQTNAYNAKGERVDVAGGGAHGYYVYSESGHVVAEHRKIGLSTPQLQREYVWLDNLPVAVHVATGAYAGEVLAVQADQLGTPRVAVRVTGAAVWAWSPTASAFGENAANSDPDGDGVSLNLDLRFPGQQFDSLTGLTYNYLRDYEPGSGRYIESDPIGLYGGFSTFSYAKTSPIVFSDSLGLDAEASCCSKARLAATQGRPLVRGYVACCGGKRYSCVIDDQDDNPEAAKVKRSCRRKHENIHRDDLQRCLCQGEGEPTGAAPQDPMGPPASPNPNQAGTECDAYTVSLPCFVDSRNRCKNNSRCEESLDREISWQRREYAKWCGTKPSI
jgi:RHS repeat-associated protein